MNKADPIEITLWRYSFKIYRVVRALNGITGSSVLISTFPKIYFSNIVEICNKKKHTQPLSQWLHDLKQVIGHWFLKKAAIKFNLRLLLSLFSYRS